MINVEIIPILNDNYVYFLEDDQTGEIALVDCGDAAPAIEFLETNGKKLDYVFVTHHHYDHTDGLSELEKRYDPEIIIPDADFKRIHPFDRTVKEGDDIPMGGKVIETHGHTVGGVSYYFPDSHIIFTGDTLFAMGCGRLFEGTPEVMFASLQKYKALPDETKIYCGHEYTKANGEFCLSVDADNTDLQKRMKDIEGVSCTIPSTIGIEKKTNAFLRADSAEAFAKLRHAKDKF